MQSPSRFVITIDGPAGAGKSTMARRLAAALGFRFLDTGAFYRALSCVALAEGVPVTDEARLVARLERLQLDQTLDGRTTADGVDLGPKLRTAEIDGVVSIVAAHPTLRARLVPLQRSFAERGPLVCEGRDTGSVIFPNADLKVWLDADPKARAERRQLEAASRGESASLESVQQRITLRDHLDSSRTAAPLQQQKDQIPVDTTGLSIDEVLEKLLALVRTRRPAGESGSAR